MPRLTRGEFLRQSGQAVIGLGWAAAGTETSLSQAEEPVEAPARLAAAVSETEAELAPAEVRIEQ